MAYSNRYIYSILSTLDDLVRQSRGNRTIEEFLTGSPISTVSFPDWSKSDRFAPKLTTECRGESEGLKDSPFEV